MIGAHGEYKLMVVFLHAISHIPATGSLRKCPIRYCPFHPDEYAKCKGMEIIIKSS